MEWSRALFDAMKSHGTGKVYVNFVADEGDERVQAAYSRRTFVRLRAIKKAYDPLNRFRMNQNIRPA
jgi:FAD/FMN-containing dehydrogenase